MRILLVEPDSATAQSVELMLMSEGMNTYTTDQGDEAIELAKLYDYDIMLLEVNLPDMSGYEVLRTLRLAKIKTPIMVVSGLAQLEDRVRGLGFGADDYLPKPFHKDELVARIHSIVRRSKGHAQSIARFGNLAVNMDARTCTVGEKHVHLTKKEYQMLEVLALREGSTVTKEMFLNHLYGGMDEPEMKIIDVFICKLRKKLSQADKLAGGPGESKIATVWGRGYVIYGDEDRAKYVPAFNEQAKQTSAPASPDADEVTLKAERISEENKVLQEQFAQMQKELGLDAGASMQDAMEKLREFKARAERELEDELPAAKVNGHASEMVIASEFSQKASEDRFAFENGLRRPIGMIFRVGSMIEVDTSEGRAANIQTGKEVNVPPVVGTILEIMAHYQGRALNKDGLIEYIFEKDHAANQAKLGQYMSQAQGVLTQLVGRPLAATIVQILSGSNYGIPAYDYVLTAEKRAALSLAAPSAEAL